LRQPLPDLGGDWSEIANFLLIDPHGHAPLTERRHER